ncbi:VOC family protein [Prosthecochloris sp. N3]|uniref:VOC family protein n=1 Tax=Prosthecochloris ethylica TaxID=2743976 RepID=A0ABR9XRY3_9CHLB|nr:MULTISPECIES: VOC family protein [Prosthecochloris]MEC9487157.1 VOC family protein [Prosthecochloris sp.]MBF0586851.1 VOC family protein [Prosthecochloris ethylica]MBF0636801.1 VOC family protein [Prosthecochloris ethylica]NUK48017.1 VOC family protein [Prosthecochloris ethylica]RNA64309.1 VOC family protein [Prosthecochloris sp. ZM_2]
MKLTGINQITLRVNDMRTAEEFYVGVLGMNVDHRAGANITYLRVNSDMVVLVKAETPGVPEARDIRVDHFGFRLPTDAEVDRTAEYMAEQGVHLVTQPANRREGRAFFVMDPDGNLIEFYSMKTKGIGAEGVSVDQTPPEKLAARTRRKMAEGRESSKPRRSRK